MTTLAIIGICYGVAAFVLVLVLAAFVYKMYMRLQTCELTLMDYKSEREKEQLNKENETKVSYDEFIDMLDTFDPPHDFTDSSFMFKDKKYNFKSDDDLNTYRNSFYRYISVKE